MPQVFGKMEKMYKIFAYENSKIISPITQYDFTDIIQNGETPFIQDIAMCRKGWHTMNENRIISWTQSGVIETYYSQTYFFWEVSPIGKFDIQINSPFMDFEFCCQSIKFTREIPKDEIQEMIRNIQSRKKEFRQNFKG